MVKTKVCNTCKKIFELTSENFYRKNGTKDGFRNYCKECSKAKIREYYNTNKEHMRKQENERRKNKNTERTDKDREKDRIQFSKYYSENSDVINERRMERYKKLSKEDKLLQSLKMKEYYKQNKDKIINNVKKYRETDRGQDIQRNYLQKRKSSKHNLEATLSVKQWNQIKKDFNNECAYCGMTEEAHLREFKERIHQEHFIPLSKGGEYTHNNIIPSCRSCNCMKHNSDFFEWYHKQVFYSKERQNKILEYLNYTDEGIQQLSIL